MISLLKALFMLSWWVGAMTAPIGCDHEWAEIMLHKDGRIVIPVLRQMCTRCWKVRNTCKHARFGTPVCDEKGGMMILKQGRCIHCGDPGEVGP